MGDDSGRSGRLQRRRQTGLVHRGRLDHQRGQPARADRQPGAAISVSAVRAGQLQGVDGDAARVHLHDQRQRVRRHEPLSAHRTAAELLDARELRGPVPDLGPAEPGADANSGPDADPGTDADPDPDALTDGIAGPDDGDTGHAERCDRGGHLLGIPQGGPVPKGHRDGDRQLHDQRDRRPGVL